MQILVRVLCGVLGFGIAALALAVTVAFYSSYGTSDSTKYTFVALAVVSLAVKMLAPAAAATVSGFRLVQTALWLGFGAAVIFDSFGVAGYVEMTYGSKTGEAARYADDYKDAAAEVSRLETLYAEYASVLPTAEIETKLEAAEAIAGKCSARRAHTDNCRAVANLKTEQARADERDKREREWREAKSKFDKMEKPSVTADPQAAVIARIGSRIGATGLADFVAPIISILIFIFFEVVGPAMVFVALHSPPALKSGQSREAPAARGAPASPKRRARGAQTDADGVLAAFRAILDGTCSAPGVSASGRRIAGPQRRLGEALGISAAKLNRHLGELRAAGTISTRTVSEGTEIIIL